MLKSIYRYEFKIKLLSGLHIGGSSDVFDIGGADSMVIKNPMTNEPYIPGSSLKGKMRSVLTKKYGKISNKNLDLEDGDLKSLFAPLDDGKDDRINVSRAIFRDAFLTEESREEIQAHLGEGNFTEIKAENSIDPWTSKAKSPRFIERVPAGAVFQGEIILQVYDDDDEEALKQGIVEAFDLLEVNYLGGSGTRGYGRVKIEQLKNELVEFNHENV